MFFPHLPPKKFHLLQLSRKLPPTSPVPRRPSPPQKRKQAKARQRVDNSSNARGLSIFVAEKRRFCWIELFEHNWRRSQAFLLFILQCLYYQDIILLLIDIPG